jgi:hypothetical protein
VPFEPRIASGRKLMGSEGSGARRPLRPLRRWPSAGVSNGGWPEG